MAAIYFITIPMRRRPRPFSLLNSPISNKGTQVGGIVPKLLGAFVFGLQSLISSAQAYEIFGWETLFDYLRIFYSRCGRRLLRFVSR